MRDEKEGNWKTTRCGDNDKGKFSSKSPKHKQRKANQKKTEKKRRGCRRDGCHEHENRGLVNPLGDRTNRETEQECEVMQGAHRDARRCDD